MDSITEKVNTNRLNAHRCAAEKIKRKGCEQRESEGCCLCPGIESPCYSTIFSLVCVLFFFSVEKKKPFRGSKDNRNVKDGALFFEAYLGNCIAFRIGLRK